MDETVISLQGKRKQSKVKETGFGIKKRRRFLDALALTCNITRAAAHAGVHLSTVWRARHRDPVFQAEWREALAIGYDRLEALVLEHGGAGERIVPDPTRAADEGVLSEAETADDSGDPAAIPAFDFERAMKVLTYRRGERNGELNRRTGCPRIQATREETNAALLKALTAAKRRIEKQRGASPRRTDGSEEDGRGGST